MILQIKSTEISLLRKTYVLNLFAIQSDKIENVRENQDNNKNKTVVRNLLIFTRRNLPVHKKNFEIM